MLAVVQAFFHRLLLDHHVDGEVFADVAEQFEIVQLAEPVEVVDDDRSVVALEAQNLFKNLHLLGDVLFDFFVCAELSFSFLAGGVADEAGAAAHDNDGRVPSFLKVFEQQDGDKVADGQGVRRGIEPRVDKAGIVLGVAKMLAQRRFIGALVKEPPPVQFVEKKIARSLAHRG